MAPHRQPCDSIDAHQRRIRSQRRYAEMPVDEFIRIAVLEFDVEHAVPVIDPVDAEDRIHALLGYAPGEVMELHGK